MDGDSAPGVAAGALGSFSPGKTPMLAHRRGPGSACVPAGGPVVLSPARAGARGDAVRCGVGEKGEEEERRETDAMVPHVSEREEKKRAPVGWAAWFSGLMGLLGRRVSFRGDPARARS
jgi:hypothetical protein